MQAKAHFLLKFTLFIGVIAFPCPTRAQEHFETQITQVGDAQMQTIVETGFFPDRQSVVFWHDPEWSIDLLPTANKDGLFSIRIRSTEGQETFVTLPDDARQIQSVVRAPGDKAIVKVDCDSERDGFLVLDLKMGGIADDVCSSDLTISPNRRFIIFDNWIANWDDSVPHEFRLYDVLKTPKENTCGFSRSDFKHERLDVYLRGVQVFPPLAACSDNDNDQGFGFGTSFTWAPDSRKIVFAAMKGKMMNLVMITIPSSAHSRPTASIFALRGSQDVCAGATYAARDQYCDDGVIKSLRWERDSVKASFHHQFGTPLDTQFTVPVSAFVPINK